MPRKSEWPRGTETQKTAFSLPKKTLNKVRVRAVQEGRTAQELIAEAIETYLKQKGGDRR